MEWLSRTETQLQHNSQERTHCIMDNLDDRETRCSPVKDFDDILERRAEKRECLRGRNNVTSCRSPTRQVDDKWMKYELQRKRQLEFLKRRSVSPDPCHSTPVKARECCPKRKPTVTTFSRASRCLVTSETLHANTQKTPTSNGRPLVLLTPSPKQDDDLSTSTWASLWSEPVAVVSQEKRFTREQAASPSVSIPTTKKPDQQRVKVSKKTAKSPKASVSTFVQNQKSLQLERFSRQTEKILQKLTREAGVQTGPGFVIVRESDVQGLADCLQEALWREEAVQKKLSVLQESASILLCSFKTLWTSRCSEDLLRNKIKALEAQLQVSLQKVPKDGVKKLVLQMEKQKVVYEEMALAAIQKATEEKAEALSEAETLQEALQAAKTEALRWQGLCEELRLTSGRLKENEALSTGQLQQLHHQLELSREQEAELREALGSLQQEKEELLYNIALLEENGETLREEIHSLRDDSSEGEDLVVQMREEPEKNQAGRRDSQLEEQLCQTQDRLQRKERECEELQTELETVEQECQSSQARLTQCREELRQLSHRRRSRRLCGSWWSLCMFLLLLLAVVGVAMLWMWHPPFREQVEALRLDVEACVEDYLLRMASSLHSGCFRPI